MRCGDVYVNGCDSALQAPSWCHAQEWPPDPDGRPGFPVLCPGLSREAVRTLAGSSERDIRHAVLAYPATALDVIDLLAGDADAGVRSHAMRRTHTLRLLRQAVRDQWTVRRAAAGNPHCPLDLLEQLSRDPDGEVRGAAVRNPAAPDHLVDAGVHDSHRNVRSWALQRTENPALIRAAAIGEDWQDREWVADNPNCPAELLVHLAKDPHPYVRAHVARNPACPDEVLRVLVTDTNESVANMARFQAPRPARRSFRRI